MNKHASITNNTPKRSLATPLAILLSIPTALGLMASWHWFADLFTHFVFQYILLLLPCLALALYRRARTAICLCALCLIWNTILLTSFLWPTDTPATSALDSPTKRIMCANVLGSNTRHDEFLAAIQDEQPDILVILELTHEWAGVIKQLQKEYPNQLLQSRGDAFGIGIISKNLEHQFDVVEIGNADVPSVLANVSAPQGTLRIIGTHTLPPVGSRNSLLRNDHLRQLAAEVNSGSGPCVVVGDLNITPWSPHFQQLLQDTGLQDTRNGHGNCASWPSKLRRFGIPIDHALVSRNIQVRDRRVRKISGSDHQAVITDIAWGAAE